MFNQARWKLTLWYLLIIMLISASFSVFIYKLLLNEVDRVSHLQQLRFERTLHDPSFFPNQDFAIGTPIPLIDPSIIEETQRRILLMLLIINFGILGIAGGLAYFLAGITLNPIQEMVDEQHRFISDASHELRTPLTALKSTLEVNLRDQKLSIAEARTLIKESIEEVDKLEKLSNDLLQLAQSKTALTFQKINLEKVVFRSVKQVSAMAKAKHIKIMAQTPNVEMEANPESLMQLMVILLDNAIKYSDAKSMIKVIGLKVDGKVHISIIDQGQGIAEAELPHIFDRFYRSDEARTRSGAGGYGLGLSIAKQIVDAHHGRIVVETTLNKGTSISLHLPLKQTSSPLSKAN